MHDCPDCSRSFKSRRALHTHRWQKHRDAHFLGAAQCHTCGAGLNDNNWQPSRRTANYQICKDCQYATNEPSGRIRRATKKADIWLVNKAWKEKTRQKARDLLGGIYQLCGVSDDLHFAHLVYLENETNRSSLRTARVVLKHPNNFLLLCVDCHFHPERYLKELIEFRARRDVGKVG